MTDQAGSDSAARSVASEVTVGVSPRVAFDAFTGEMDLWWVRGPINFFDAARAAAMVCEPGVGGRILEVYDADTGDALELGKTTIWTATSTGPRRRARRSSSRSASTASGRTWRRTRRAASGRSPRPGRRCADPARVQRPARPRPETQLVMSAVLNLAQAIAVKTTA
jgi:hypothetical protein